MTGSRRRDPLCDRHRLRWAALTTTVAITALGCSGSPEPKPEGTPASALCAGTLDATAAAALRRLTGADTFDEFNGGGASGKPERFSLEWAASQLHAGLNSNAECDIYNTAAKDGGDMVLFMSFAAIESSPTRDQVAAWNREIRARDRPRYTPLTFFPMGAVALTEGSAGTRLIFKCRTRGEKGETQYVVAEMRSPRFGKTGSLIKDRMVILNSVSRRLAEHLGCAAEANLPATVPDPEPS